MEGQEIVLHRSPASLSFTLRDYVSMGFRHRRAFLLCFFAVLLGTLTATVLWPKYRAETEILVRRERVDPVVTSEQTSPVLFNNQVTEEELNSELELIRSEDVLRKVVLQCGLQKTTGGWFHLRPDTPERAIAEAIVGLNDHLGVEAVPKTDIIRVSYTSRNPTLAAAVLKALDQAYLEKHKEVRRPAGEFAFFDKQTEEAKTALATAEQRLKQFPQQKGTPNPTLARDITLQKLNDFNTSLGQTQSRIAELQQRIKTLDNLEQTTPPRLTTQMRQADDAPVLQQMKSTLLTLELKRSEMAFKFQPSYPPLQEVEREITETQAAIKGERPLHDNTTDQNPAYVWVNSELVKAQTELHGEQARAAETEGIIRRTLASARQLDVNSVEQQDLIRSETVAQDKYLLYMRKREEARITDELDQTHILNVAISEQPAVPALPARSPMMMTVLATMLALTMSTGLLFTLEYFDPSFRTPTEVEAVLNLPLLAAVPSHTIAGLSGRESNPTPAADEVAH